MRRKGKPKAKTKLASINCDSDQQLADNQQPGQQVAAPLISISHAPVGGSPTSRIASETNSLNQPETAPQLAHGDTGRETVVLFDAKTETTRRRVLDNSRGGRLERFKGERFLQRFEMSSGIELVRQSYIKLLARNSLYQFHLGSFAFSVMNSMFLLTFNCCTLRLPGDDDALAQLHDTTTTTTGPDNNNTNQTTANCDNDPANDWSRPLQDLRRLVWHLLASLLLATTVQLIVISLEFYVELRQCRGGRQRPKRPPEDTLETNTSNSTNQHKDSQSDRSQRVAARQLTSLAVGSSHFLLLLPTLVFYASRWPWRPCQGESAAGLPLTPVAATGYLLTNLSLTTVIHSSSRLVRCLYFLLLLLPVLCATGAREHDDQRFLTYFVYFVALSLSVVRSRLFISTHLGATFEQADQLIEAKVSLEQQRQQQETLLLSVLPAYVAEQVKRNMLKKMDTAKEPVGGRDLLDGQSDLPQAPMSSSSNASGPPGGQPPAASTPLHSLRSLTLPANCDGPPLAPRDHQETALVPKRLSFAARLKLGPSLQSGRSATSDQNLGQAADQPLQTPVVGSSTTTGPNQFNSLAPQVHQSHQSRRGFNELYIRTYNNVSLLYGDIVGFTRLCSQLSSSQLVRVLNNLFSYFDYLAEQHKIMRIKILGDCYYGVSGIPEFAVLGAKSSSSPRHHFSSGQSQPHHSPAATGKSGDNHAINCVNMGLDMIHYIKCLNIERTSRGADDELNGDELGQTELPANFELNMRIGIHTGHIHSGVIGLKKWQFDVWSNDVSIAMHCESSGVAGRVQVTEATVQHLRNAFTFEQAARSSRDTFLADRSIRTFLIVDRVQFPKPTSRNHLLWKEPQAPQATDSDATNQKQHSKPAPTYSFAPSEIQAMDRGRIREATIGTIRQTLLASELGGSGGGGAGCGSGGGGAGGGSPLASSGLARLEHNDMRWWTLEFKDPVLNVQFGARLIPAKHYLGQLCLLFLLLVVLIQTLNFELTDRNDHDKNESLLQVLLAGSALTLPLVAAGLLPKRRSAPDTILHRRQSALSDGASVGRGSNRPSPVHWIRANDLPIDDEHTQLQSNEPIYREHNKWVRCFKLMRLNKLCSKLKPVVEWRRFGGEREANAPLGLYLVALFFVLFVLLQFNLLLSATCDQLQQDQADPATSVARHRLKQLYQLTIFCLLMALDLCPSLLTYRLRAAFLVVISLVQFITLSVTAATLLPRREGNLQFQQLLPASHLLGSLCGRRQSHGPVGPSPDGARPTPASDIGHNLLEWSGDALLLVLSFWSWAFQRQLEYSQRASFLWRNRLNVDHEELEYISGINKVLLENILPSHVVQHYLEHPTATALSNNNEMPVVRENAATNACEQQQRDRKASRVLVASGNQLMGVGMSSSQLRSLPGFRSPNTRASHQANQVGHELYHEQHESIAVMFASIPHFYEFYDESDISKQGLGCIALLNEIICDFDKLLLKNKFSRIEKIKTIGSTYMAAAGLRPSCPANVSSARTSNASQISQQTTASDRNSDWQQQQQQHFQPRAPNCLQTTEQIAAAASAQSDRRLVLSQQKMNLICMIQFATSLMSALNGINKQSFQLFKLRVGVNTGPVVAGIIGAQRPFYDIWGDCVNIASRMESLGEVGRIQVEERTAKLLSECLCPETYAIEKRGPIDVKGKGGMVTYFVDKRQQPQSPQPAQPLQQQQQQQQHESES